MLREIPSQTLLPATLNCSITGSVDQKAIRVNLHVSCDKDVEVIAWWPKAWGGARINVGGKVAQATPVRFGPEDFVRFAVEKGEWEVVIDRSRAR